MAAVNHIESNVVGLRAGRETSFKTVSSPDWEPLSPTGYGPFGRTNNKAAQEPINDSRQREKSVVVGHDSAAEFSHNLTQDDHLPNRFETFFQAALRTKDELAVADVNTTTDDFQPAAGGDAYVAGDLLFASGFDDDTNNGLHLVTGSPSATSIPVTTNLVTATGQSGQIRRVGFEFIAGDATIDASGDLPQLVTTDVGSAKDLTELDLVEGEIVWLGGDTAGTQFETAANLTWARVRSVTASAITFDKAGATLVTDADGDDSQTVRIFFASRVLKNEAASLRSVIHDQLERSLGAPDDAQPTQIQYQYVKGATGNTLGLTVPSEGLVTLDLGYVAGDTEYIDGPTSEKAGARPTKAKSDAYTSVDILAEEIQEISQTDENPSNTFAIIQESSLSIDNNLSGLKGHGQDGSFAINSGFFSVSLSLTVYFADVTSLQTLQDNDSLTYHLLLTKGNKGFFADAPLCSAGNEPPNVAINEPVTLPLELDASRGCDVHANLDHTLCVGWFDYLPNAAMPA